MGKGKGEKEAKEVEQEEELDRGNWDNQCDFFLSCLGYAVGLGNVWRFPYLCYEHGGVTFLIAYLTMLLVSGLPLFFLELSLGQWAGKGPLKVFGRMAPIAKGLGYGMLMISFLVVIYYNLIIAWTIYYTFAGFTSELPWTYCGTDSLTSRDCYQREQAMQCYNSTSGQQTFWNKTCTPVAELCQFFNMTLSETELNETLGLDMKMNEAMCSNGTEDFQLNKVYKRVSPSEDYYKRTMLGLEEDIDWSNMGGLKADLVGCLAAAWFIVCLCLIKGVQSSGKVVYFTALFPYFVLLILLIRGATLEGAYDGILFYVYPTAEKLEGLKDVKVWAAAATQIFYSLGPSFGGLITLASYNKFSNNCHRDAILIAFSNCATSIFAGFVIFSIVGFMANQQGVGVADAIASGTGLAFIAYPEAVTQMPFPPIWSFLFFTMLITLGLDSQFTMVETITTAIMDQWPKTRAHKGKVVIGACVAGFLLGLTCTSRGGLFMFSLIDWYASSWGLLICAVTEVLLVMYLYGWRNFMDNIEEMGIRIPKVLKGYWLLMWLVVTPAVLILVFVMTFVQYSPAYSSSLLPGQEEKYLFPGGIQALGIIMSFSPFIIIILGGVYQLWRRNSQGKSTSFKAMTSPNEKWCSAVADKNKNRAGLGNVSYMKDEVAITDYKYQHGM
jgi:solute carrier family 6 amino acid transporter-like protein 5/7/9/14